MSLLTSRLAPTCRRTKLRDLVIRKFRIAERWLDTIPVHFEEAIEDVIRTSLYFNSGSMMSSNENIGGVCRRLPHLLRITDCKNLVEVRQSRDDTGDRPCDLPVDKCNLLNSGYSQRQSCTFDNRFDCQNVTWSCLSDRDFTDYASRLTNGRDQDKQFVDGQHRERSSRLLFLGSAMSKVRARNVEGCSDGTDRCCCANKAHCGRHAIPVELRKIKACRAVPIQCARTISNQSEHNRHGSDASNSEKSRLYFHTAPNGSFCRAMYTTHATRCADAKVATNPRW